jgi:hypothetical protein
MSSTRPLSLSTTTKSPMRIGWVIAIWMPATSDFRAGWAAAPMARPNRPAEAISVAHMPHGGEAQQDHRDGDKDDHTACRTGQDGDSRGAGAGGQFVVAGFDRSLSTSTPVRMAA